MTTSAPSAISALNTSPLVGQVVPRDGALAFALGITRPRRPQMTPLEFVAAINTIRRRHKPLVRSIRGEARRLMEPRR